MFQILHSKNERFLSLKSYQLRFEPKYLFGICFVSQLDYFSQMRQQLSGDPISQIMLNPDVLKLSFVEIRKKLALEFQGLTLSYA